MKSVNQPQREKGRIGVRGLWCIYAPGGASASRQRLLMVSQGWRYSFAGENAAGVRCGLSASKKAYNNASFGIGDLAAGMAREF